MARVSAAIDLKTPEEGQHVSGCKSEREAIDRALREFVTRRLAQELSCLAGKVLVEMSSEGLPRWGSRCARREGRRRLRICIAEACRSRSLELLHLDDHCEAIREQVQFPTRSLLGT